MDTNKLKIRESNSFKNEAAKWAEKGRRLSVSFSKHYIRPSNRYSGKKECERRLKNYPSLNLAMYKH
mgnify:CR=1 FL=1